MNAIVIYYSTSGRTEVVAKTISENLETDIVKIKDLKDRKGVKNKMAASLDAFREKKTKIQPIRVDLTEYDTVFFGTPTWANNPTPAIITIIDRCDLRAKDVVLFTTMSGSGGSATIKRMEEKVEARGARVIGKFIVKTKNKSKNALIKESEFIINKIKANES
ncbi:flavodoxin family protein [Methanobrevibacter sp. DSM 116169]|uniref:flavodoxin family protein n=1 Tax=Methanobrevibacter sp. DSM 116169 TaxID=3242727 RepID=UPI0038FCF9E3